MVKGIEDIDSSQIVAVPLEDSLEGEPAHLQTEAGVLLEEVERCAAERVVLFWGFGKFKPVAGLAQAA